MLPQHSRTAEVSELEVPLHIAEDVAALDIPVHDVEAVEVGYRLYQLSRVLSNQPFLEAAEFAKHRAQAPTDHELHDYV